MDGQSVLLILGAVAAAAAAVKGALYLWETARHGGSRLIAAIDEKRRVRRVMAELTDDDGWPNGAASLPASHRSLYDKMAETRDDVAEIKMTVKEIQRAVEDLFTS